MVLLNTYLGGDEEIHTIPQGFSLKVSVRARLDFELSSYKLADQRVSRYTKLRYKCLLSYDFRFL